jgi:Xaa-Pro aminopeptidase
MSFRVRQKRALARLCDKSWNKNGAELDGLLVTHLPDVRYLCGFTGSSAVLVLSAGRTILYTDGRYAAQAKAEAKVSKIVILQKGVLAAACEGVVSSGINRCGFDAAHTTVATVDAMRAALKANPAVSASPRRKLFVPTEPIVAALREVKDLTEIEFMRSAALTGCKLFDSLLGFIRSGLTEVAVAAELEYAARIAGAEGMSFETIVASGARSALPHGRATTARLPKNGFLTLDFGVVLEGYCSDMTRTVYLGRASQEEFAVYDAVLEAQEAAVAAVAPGVAVGDVDEAARSVLRRAKLEKYFTHSTGHGVGLEIHEGPRLAAEQKQKLQAGMVVTIEPGVYIPGKFGVRIEDMVLVTAGSGEILTPSVKAWTQL